MKVKISRDYDMWESVLRNDINNTRRFGKVTRINQKRNCNNDKLLNMEKENYDTISSN